MTKPRRPLTPQRALARITDLIGFDGAADVLGKSEWTLRKWSDPDTGREVSFQAAVRLDAAFRRADGLGSPFLECFAAQLELVDDDGDHQTLLLAATAGAAKETGEAVCAAIEAANRSGDPALRMRALIEVEEGIASLTALHASIKRMGGTW